jgi:copper chaperone
MISFQVSDMTCGHCVGAITKALKGVDANARVQFDLSTHRVDIDAGETTAARLQDAIMKAGYTPVAIESPAGDAVAGAVPARRGCCCGS